MSDRPRRGSDRGRGGRPGRGPGRGTRFSRDDRPGPERVPLAPYPERPRPTFIELFRTTRPLIGVVHLKPLPGSPGYDGLFLDLLDAALFDARAIEAGGAAALIVENFGDAPFYPDQVPAETIAAMTRLVTEIRKAVRIPVGVNVLRNDARAGVAVAAATGAGFVRINVHTGTMVTDQGVISGRAFESVRLRESLRSRTLLFADIRVKHGLPLVEFDLAREAEDTVMRGRADALIVTGEATGSPADLESVASIKAALPGVPVLVGSGVDFDTVEAVFRAADGCIVGTALKEDGRIDRPVDEARVRALAEVAERLAPRRERFRGDAEIRPPRMERRFERDERPMDRPEAPHHAEAHHHAERNEEFRPQAAADESPEISPARVSVEMGPTHTSAEMAPTRVPSETVFTAPPPPAHSHGADIDPVPEEYPADDTGVPQDEEGPGGPGFGRRPIRRRRR